LEGVRKRSVNIAGHRTSVSLEEPFWDALKAVAATEGRSVQALIAAIDSGRGRQNLSSAVRVFLFDRARAGGLGPKGPSADAAAAPA
jgi:predicted DNA-binding ribbon-helix-helix protein